jgi:Platelet-activating factor acetylhydrolase, isoform II
VSFRAIAPSVIACFLAAMSALTLPELPASPWRPAFSPRLLEPSGIHDVGVRRTRLDTGADDPWDPGRTRVLMVDVHYPAAEGEDPLGYYALSQYMSELGMLAWSPDHERHLGLREGEVNWLFRTHSHEWAPPRDGRFPVIVISAPEAGMRTSFTTLAEDLASHGFIAVTVDHPYDAPAVELWPTREVIEPGDAERQLPDAAADPARAADVAAVADRVAHLDPEIGEVVASECVVVVSGDLEERVAALTDEPMIEAQIAARHPRTASALGTIPSLAEAERRFRVEGADLRDALAARLAQDPGCRTGSRFE